MLAGGRSRARGERPPEARKDSVAPREVPEARNDSRPDNTTDSGTPHGCSLSRRRSGGRSPGVGRTTTGYPLATLRVAPPCRPFPVYFFPSPSRRFSVSPVHLFILRESASSADLLRLHASTKTGQIKIKNPLRPFAHSPVLQSISAEGGHSHRWARRRKTETGNRRDSKYPVLLGSSGVLAWGILVCFLGCKSGISTDWTLANAIEPKRSISIQ
jgi:hypothetical protein